MTEKNCEGYKGLDKLNSLDRVIIRDKTKEFPSSKYVVTTVQGDVVFHAKGDSGILDKVLAGNNRSFEIDVFDTDDREVIKLRRPYSLGQDKMDVTVCGQPAAIVRKEVTFFKPVLSINDASDKPVLRVKGPVSTTSECDFELYSTDKKRIGAICKRWSGLTRGHSERDSFVLVLPPLDVRYKAAVIATCFLIDFLYYEN